jgi:predicted RNA-binding Zn-ribbon protein involved in translation (DUF1610 family)
VAPDREQRAADAPVPVVAALALPDRDAHSKVVRAMTWRIIQRGDASAPIVATFECAAHGTFEATVSRDASEHPCPTCGTPSSWRISAPLTRVRLGEVTHRGKSDPPPPGALRTDKMADGQTANEYRAKRSEIQRQRRLAQNRRMIGR